MGKLFIWKSECMPHNPVQKNQDLEVLFYVSLPKSRGLLPFTSFIYRVKLLSFISQMPKGFRSDFQYSSLIVSQ